MEITENFLLSLFSYYLCFSVAFFSKDSSVHLWTICIKRRKIPRTSVPISREALELKIKRKPYSRHRVYGFMLRHAQQLNRLRSRYYIGGTVTNCNSRYLITPWIEWSAATLNVKHTIPSSSMKIGKTLLLGKRGFSTKNLSLDLTQTSDIIYIKVTFLTIKHVDCFFFFLL